MPKGSSTTTSVTNSKVSFHALTPTDMVFDDDAKLSGLYSRYEEEPDEMKSQIVQYITSDTFEESALLVI